MLKSKLCICLCMLTILTVMLMPNLNVTSAAPQKSQKYVPGEVIIGLKDAAVESFSPVLSSLGATVKREMRQLNAFSVKVAEGAEDGFIQSMKARPEVAFAEKNGIVEAAFVPNDPNWGSQWNMPMIKANTAWDTYRGSADVTVAILDSGILYTHPDLAANYRAGGYDWVNNDFNPIDDNSHGTHCAGIVAAVLNNAVGVAGVAQVRVWAEKVLDNVGTGSWDDAASGIVHATDKGVNVISMSFSGGYSSLLLNAVNYAYGKGVILVAAAGNDNQNIDLYPTYPASYTNVIAVSATTSSDLKASYSNYGNKIEVSAPGSSIYSTVLGNSYGSKSGTSMATPHVAGLAALIWSYKPQLTNVQVRSELQKAVDDIGAVGRDMYYGYGRINCQKTISSPEKYQYKFSMSGFTDKVYVNVTSQAGGMLINGKANVTAPDMNYPAPVLGWGVGNSFYMIFDYRQTTGSFDTAILVGTISTASGKMYRTVDGKTWTGPIAVSLVPFAATEETEGQPSAAEAEIAAIQYVEGLNPTGTVETTRTYSAQEFGIRYVPTISYPLKKIELMAGGGTGLFTVQLRTESGGYPSSTVLRQAEFTMSDTMAWQGAEFETAYTVAAGTPYWIVFTPVPGSRTSTAVSGADVTQVHDFYSDGIDWDGISSSLHWMAKFYREVQPYFQYHFNVNPFVDKVYVNVASQTGGMLIYGLVNYTQHSAGYPAPILGWGAGNSFYMPFDYRTDRGSGGSELGLLVGTISTASGKLYRTIDGVTWVGPTAVTLGPFAASENAKPSAIQ